MMREAVGGRFEKLELPLCFLQRGQTPEHCRVSDSRSVTACIRVNMACSDQLSCFGLFELRLWQGETSSEAALLMMTLSQSR
jgi:hypothetical protein